MNSRIGIFAIASVVVLVIMCVDATPSGYFREQREYQKNEERYVNGELQHSSKDAEFLAKQGELAAVTISPPLKHHFRHHEEYDKKKEEREEGEHDSRVSSMKQMHEGEHREQIAKQQPQLFLVNAASGATAYGHRLRTDEHTMTAGSYDMANLNSYGRVNLDTDNRQHHVWNGPTEYVPTRELSSGHQSYESSSGRDAGHLSRVTLHKDSGIRKPYNWAPNTVIDENAAAQMTQQCYEAWKVYSNQEMNRKLQELNKDTSKQYSLQRMQASDAKAAAERAQQYRYSQRQQYSANSFHSTTSQ